MKFTEKRLFDELVQVTTVGLISRAADELAQRRGRAPTPSEIAAHLRIGRDEVLEGLEAGYASHLTSLDQPRSADTTSATLSGTLGKDTELTGVDDREALWPLFKGLPERERLILGLRFVHNMTQSQIAARIGISQVHVSRLLARTLETLRAGLG